MLHIIIEKKASESTCSTVFEEGIFISYTSQEYDSGYCYIIIAVTISTAATAMTVL